MNVKVIDFYAEWCGPCDRQEPILEEIESEYGVNLEKVDVEESRDVANDYSVRSLPTIVVEKDGQIADRFVGLTQKMDIVESFA